MICKEFIIKDIIDYMNNKDVDIIEDLCYCNLSTMVDIIMIGNKCMEEEAEKILYETIDKLGLEQTAINLAYEIIGKKPDEKDEVINKNKYSSFSEVLEDFYDNIQTVDKNFSLDIFWNMSTRYLYKYSEGVKKRYVNDKNLELQSQYSNAMMIGQMLAGKLKECPQLNEDGTLHKETLAEKIKKLKQGGL